MHKRKKTTRPTNADNAFSRNVLDELAKSRKLLRAVGVGATASRRRRAVPHLPHVDGFAYVVRQGNHAVNRAGGATAAQPGDEQRSEEQREQFGGECQVVYGVDEDAVGQSEAGTMTRR